MHKKANPLLRDLSMFIPTERLASWSADTAAKDVADGEKSLFAFRKALKRDLDDIDRICKRVVRRRSERAQSGELAWLLDNRYLVRREGELVLRQLRSMRFERLPASGGEILIAGCARALLQSGALRLDRDRYGLFLEGYQKRRPLSERELWLFVPMLKAACASNIAELARRSLANIDRGGEDEQEQFYAACFTTLRTLAFEDFSDLTEAHDSVEEVLRLDPAGIYEKMDEESRAYYRSRLAREAKKNGLLDKESAQLAVELSKRSSGRRRHVGYYILEDALGRGVKKNRGAWYIPVLTLLSAAVSLGGAFLLDRPLLSLLFVFPAFELWRNVIEAVTLRFTKPSFLPSLDFSRGIPDSARTLCVISALIVSDEDARRCPALLEEYRLANREGGENVIYGLLADLPDSPEREGESEEHILRTAELEIRRLNERYSGGFCLFTRPRCFSRREGRYTPRERKRGAIMELVRLLTGQKSELTTAAGEPSALEGTAFLLTLDADTRPGIGSIALMAGAMAHPLHRPVIKNRVVAEGYGILQPRLSVQLEAAGASLFSRVFAGRGGTDPYGALSGELQQDLFGRASFAGKGLIDVMAYKECMDGRLPKRMILSHDLLEGEYLRTARFARAELIDGFPRGITAFYTRLHRWTRGDWQTLPWLFPCTPTAGGSCERNVLGPVSRFKIFDNLRRSLTPAAVLAVWLTAVFSGEAWAALAAAGTALCFFSRSCVSGAQSVLRGGLRERYRTGVLSGPRAAVLRIILQLVLLPYETTVCVGAAVTALYRMLFTRTHLLDWVTAAQADSRGSGPVRCLRRMALPSALGLLCICFGASSLWRLPGALWLFSPLIAAAAELRRKNERPLKEDDVMFLRGQCEKMWGYFSDFMRPEDHYLLPDNIQEHPEKGPARRTSPTNIGLSLLSVLTALDLGLTTQEKALALIEGCLTSVEKLQKWHGHLYNWYDTSSCCPLCPPTVSTVDSGNLAGCLIALSQGLRELRCEKSSELALRAYELASSMDFRPLYDPKRHLLHIGYRVDTGELTPNCYDLLESEARQTSFIAIAQGQIEPRHWRALSRTLVRKCGYKGMASWTGTMFEYLMPELLLPLVRDSSLWESAAFCVWVHRRRTKNKTPWGISESAYYSFDETLDYRYKANGVQALGLRRKLDDDLVIAPYATYLALQVDPYEAVRNLRRLSEMNMQGRYGLYEAADFTPGRAMPGQPSIVRCYMAHHLGMSMVAASNALTKNKMQKRFMSDPRMSAYAELLRERVPEGSPILSEGAPEPPEMPRRGAVTQVRSLEGFGLGAEDCALLSNGLYSIAVSRTGHTHTRCGGRVVMMDSSGDTPGVQVEIETAEGSWSFTPAPTFQGTYTSEFSGNAARFISKHGDVRCEEVLHVLREEPGELREITLTNEGRVPVDGAVKIRLTPVLERYDSYASHPAFSKLFLHAEKREGGALVTRRAARGVSAVSLFAAVSCSDTEISLERAPRGGGGSGGGEVSLTFGLNVSLRPGGSQSLRFAAALGDDGDAAVRAAERALEAQECDYSDRASEFSRLPSTAAFSHLDALYLLRRLAWPQRGSSGARAGRGALYARGISGDLPIVAARAEDIELAQELVLSHRYLSYAGWPFDLVFSVPEEGYDRPAYSALLRCVRRSGCEGDLGMRGGVHLVPRSCEEEIFSFASAVCPLTQLPPEESALRGPYRRREPPAKRARSENAGAEYVLFSEGSLPDVVWSDVLSNPDFGCLASDCGLMGSWYRNARENRLTPWDNDPLAEKSSETLELIIGSGDGASVLTDGLTCETEQGVISVFAASDGFDCAVRYGRGYTVWDKQMGTRRVITHAFVPIDAPCRVLLVRTEGCESCELLLKTPFVLASSEKEGENVSLFETEDGVGAKNLYNESFPSQTALVLSKGAKIKLQGKTASLRAGGSVTGVFVLGCAGTQEEERRIRSLTDPKEALRSFEKTKAYWRELCSRIRIETPDSRINDFVNNWAVYQTLACRMWGRCSVYQCGGAYGFRDQLQDVCALLYCEPEFARVHLLRAASKQFSEGDCAHWWHELGDGTARGVRTRCSDDLMWLPYAVSEYVKKTGDISILDEEVPFLTAEPLREGETDRYAALVSSTEKADMMEHCRRAVREAISRGVGAHGLPLIGGGDWNDGMDRLGILGKGESVWLAWFFAVTMRGFAELCAGEERQLCLNKADSLTRAANRAWDGMWFLRGYYDDGSPLGSRVSAECKIDAIAQGFAPLAGADPEKARTALESACRELIDREHNIVRLFDPPFSGRGGTDPGYIASYPPGVRENGGQYTHGAIWLAMGCLQAGMKKEGLEILRMIAPPGADNGIYRAEPWVIAADVSGAVGREGRCGWSWYTGSAGWFYRVVLEDLLGLKLRNGLLSWDPGRLPEGWSEDNVRIMRAGQPVKRLQEEKNTV